ncbi:hypothetical protein ATCC90586_006162 [Pythium insidiosum]|nr:hypothetical protein ATCC90586_006162 [Pythium insidiosum]
MTHEPTQLQPKHTLDFILNTGGRRDGEPVAPVDEANAPRPTPTVAAGRPRRRGLTYEEKRMARKCSVDGCLNYTINRGLCFRHGGGKQCSVEGCRASAKVAGLCWKHGGSIPCVIEGCERRGKSRGLCWAHGGGSKCQADACAKVAVSNGFCWAHGGGKRCVFEGCRRPAYERTFNYCTKHYEQLQDGKETVEV